MQFNRDAGRMFQGGALASIELPENFKRFSSPDRQRATRYLPKPITAVIPDGVTVAQVAVKQARRSLPEVELYVDSTFFEVKATRKTLHLPSSRYQMTGLLDALSMSPVRLERDGVPWILFLTTLDTRIGSDVLQLASARRLAVWQLIAHELPEKIDGHVAIRFGPAVLLNPEVLAGQDVFPGYFSRPAPLRPDRPPSTNIDPTEVDGE